MIFLGHFSHVIYEWINKALLMKKRKNTRNENNNKLDFELKLDQGFE